MDHGSFKNLCGYLINSCRADHATHSPRRMGIDMVHMAMVVL
jgi:hypothetical protein